MNKNRLSRVLPVLVAGGALLLLATQTPARAEIRVTVRFGDTSPCGRSSYRQPVYYGPPPIVVYQAPPPVYYYGPPRVYSRGPRGYDRRFDSCGSRARRNDFRW
ncbi:MAG: hypothetical protein SFY92_12755 [Verrucomicrobiae bacterium]|nr:hypothetical protein [Verrucomicrobiae bacterium]